jgi:glycerol uptake facilitator-like aquaporin
MATTLTRRAAAEALGTGLLVASVVGSGIMGERLAGGNVAIALLANTLATGAALLALILALGPVSGAHFNPVVTLVDVWQGGLRRGHLLPYVGAQLAGAVAGVALANAMFEEPVFAWSRHVRQGGGQVLSEVVATFGLVVVITVCARRQPRALPGAVASYITAAYWFTASTSFANPAVTLARSLTNTFAGIRPVDVPAFVAAQLVGGALASWLTRWLVPPAAAPHAVLSHVPSTGDAKEAS